MKKILAWLLIISLLADPAYGVTKLSAIASGGVEQSTDQEVVVRSGNTDLLVNPATWVLSTTARLHTIPAVGQVVIDSTTGLTYIGDGSTAGGVPSNQGNVNHYAGWSVIGEKSSHTKTPLVAQVDGQSTRMELVPTFNVSKVAFAYSSNGPYINTDNPFTNSLYLDTTIQGTNLALNAGNTANQDTGLHKPNITFGGISPGVLFPGAILLSDPYNINLIANTRSFDITHATVPLYAAPAQPVLTATAGAGIAAGTYPVGITIVDAKGVEGPCTAATVTTSSTNLQITVTDPGLSNYPYAIGYHLWINPIAGTALPARLFNSGKGLIQFGTAPILSILPNSGAEQNMSAQLCSTTGTALTVPNATSNLGGTAAGASANGEYVGNNFDYTKEGFSRSGNLGNGSIAPWFVLGYDPSGKVHTSYAFIGDSIATDIADYGFGYLAFGGYMVRAATNQANNRYYSATIAPYFAYIMEAVGGETSAEFAGVLGDNRRAAALYTTNFVDSYGTNDLSGASTSALSVAATDITGLQPLINNGLTGLITTITPDHANNGQVTALADFSWPRTGVSIYKECNRRQLNNFRTSLATATSTVTGEAPCGVYSGTLPHNFNWYKGGDGTATTFLTAMPFVVGSETPSVAGTPTAAYTYYSETTLSGVAYASGVILNTAPTDGAAVTINYTAAPGFIAVAGWTGLVYPVDVTAGVEVNSAGTPTYGGGLWNVPSGTIATGTSSGSNTSVAFNDTTQSWTQDQYRNYVVVITADSTVPTAINDYSVIVGNTATSMQISFANVSGSPGTPDANAVYAIIDPYPNSDTLHPAPRSHMAEAQTLLNAINAHFPVQ